MNAKQLTIKTITDNRYQIGKSIKGKGLEVFDEDSTIFYCYGLLEDGYLEKFINKISENNMDSLYAASYYLDGNWSRERTFESQPQPFSKLYKEIIENNKRFSSVKIMKKGALLGHISVSKYDSSKNSQMELCEDLIALSGLSIYGDAFEDNWEMDYDDGIKKFENHNDCYHNGDYFLEHGSSWCEPEGDCEYINGRLRNYNSSELDFFEFDEGEYLKEIDPNETISVYHRKAKDWYVGYSLNSEEMIVNYKEDDYEYEKDECDEASAYYYTYKENKELIEEVTQYVIDTKESLEFSGYVNNELDPKCLYRDTSVNFNLIEYAYGEISELKDDIFSTLDNDYKNIKSNFQKCLEEHLYSKVKINHNSLKVEIESYETGKFEQFNHLLLIDRLGKRYNYELVNTKINDSDSVTTYAIKQGSEEFHFDILEVIMNDISDSGILEEETLKEFIVRALSALEQRRLEKTNEKELFEKASKVFIGFQDSTKSGNCNIGTKSFADKHKIDMNVTGGIRGDVLLSLEKSNFTVRAVSYAIANH